MGRLQGELTASCAGAASFRPFRSCFDPWTLSSGYFSIPGPYPSVDFGYLDPICRFFCDTWPLFVGYFSIPGPYLSVMFRYLDPIFQMFFDTWTLSVTYFRYLDPICRLLCNTWTLYVGCFSIPGPCPFCFCDDWTLSVDYLLIPGPYRCAIPGRIPSSGSCASVAPFRPWSHSVAPTSWAALAFPGAT